MPLPVLLVNPYIYDFTAYDLWLRPLGLMYIAASLRKYTDCQLYWLDTLDRHSAGSSSVKDHTFPGRGKYLRTEVEKPEIYKHIPRRYARYGMPIDLFYQTLEELPEVDIILVTSLMTYWVQGAAVTIDALRRRFRKAKIVLGGILPNLVQPEILKTQLNADIFFKGYGESKILDLVEAHGAAVSGRPDPGNLDDLPFPALDFNAHTSSAPLLTARGCPFSCTYCVSHLLNPRFLQRSADSVSREIIFHHQRFGTTDFAVFDDALLLNKQRRFLRIFKKINQQYHLRFHTPNGLHAGEIDQETAETLYAAGFKTIRLSFESIDHDILARSSGKVTVAQMERAVVNLEAAGYRRSQLGVYLLTGFPGQQLKQVEAALDFASGLGVIPHLCYFTPVPGSRDFYDLIKAGHLTTPVDLYQTNKLYFLYTRSGFSHEQIQALKTKTAGIIERVRRQ